MYSTIKPKTGICIDCADGTLKRLIAGRCQYHYKSYRGLMSLERQKENYTENDESEKRNEWFRLRTLEMTGHCAECGASTNKYVFKYAICSVAHILPKSVFKSVQFHPLNWLELGAQCGCHSKSEVWSDAVKMKVWPIMVERFLTFHSQIAANERKHLPSVLLKELQAVETARP